MVKIMTDTNSGLTPEKAKELGVALIPMPFFVDGEEYFEYVSMTQGEFFEKMESGADVSTSQPAPGAITAMWDELLKTYEGVVYIPMSSGLSGTCETAKALALDYDGRVFVVDNKRISITLYNSVLDALELAGRGKSAAEIAQYLEKTGLNASIYVSVNTLEYLKKSGRVTAAGAAIGSILGIKPVLQIQGGKLDAYKKVRGIKAAMTTMIDGIKADYDTRFAGKNRRICVAFSGDEQVGNEWQKTVKEAFPDYEIRMEPLSISISCHVGPGAVGVAIDELVPEDI